MMAANYQHIGGHENRLGRHYSRFSAFWSPADLTDQSLALRKSQNAGSNGRSRASSRTRQGGGLDTRSSQQGGLALFGRRESAPVGLPVEFPRQDLCSGPG